MPPTLNEMQKRQLIADIEVRNIDTETRTVEVACSSEYVVSHWYGTETLLHGSDNVRLNRFENKAALLYNHMRDEPIGVIESARVDADKKLRATVRFGKDEYSDKRFQQVVDGILNHTSIGYLIHNYEVDKDENYRITDWEPYELSFVTVPADPDVGQGRQHEENRQREKPPKPEPKSPPVEPEDHRSEKDEDPMPQTLTPEEAAKETQRQLEEAEQRSATILELGERHNALADASRFIREKKTPEEFRDFLLERKASQSTKLDNSLPGLPAQPKQQFRSLGENLAAIITAERTGHKDERLLSQANAKDGGYIIDSQFDAELMAKTFDSSLILSRVDRFPLADEANPIVTESRLKKSDSGDFCQVYWMEDNAEYKDVDGQFEAWETRAHKIGGKYEVTEQMMNSEAQLEAVMSTAIVHAFVTKIEHAVVHGNGIKKPLGILKGPGLVTEAKETSQTAATIVVQNIMKMFSRIPLIDDSTVWLTSRSAMPQIMGLTLGSSPMYIPPGGISGAPNGTLLGIPIAYDDQLPVVGDKGDIVLARMRDYRLVDNETTESASSIHVQFLRDINTFKFRRYVGGQPKTSKAWNTNGNYKVSPYITLAERA